MIGMRLAVALSLVLSAQPAAITVSALVVDESGAPLAGVVIDGLYFSSFQFAKTGENGRAENRTSFPRLAFRKPGYQTVIAAPEPQMKVVMKTPPTTSIPRCTAPPSGKWDPLFRLPPQPSARPNRDADYDGSFIPVATASGTHILRHGYGPNWSNGHPSYQELRKSTAYEEENFLSDPAHRINITVANGILPDGTHWRFLGRHGESLDYWTKDRYAAKKLDALMDSACLALPAAP
jgi:hypothetical protein